MLERFQLLGRRFPKTEELKNFSTKAVEKFESQTSNQQKKPKVKERKRRPSLNTTDTSDTSLERPQTHLSQPEPPQPPKLRCTCKKSKCLKLYCVCFRDGSVCGSQCGCLDCKNTKENSGRVARTKEELKIKNPISFSDELFELGDGSKILLKGCNCKKSKCNNNYCECHQNGARCSDFCNCAECHNMKSVMNLKEKEKAGDRLVQILHME